MFIRRRVTIDRNPEVKRLQLRHQPPRILVMNPTHRLLHRHLGHLQVVPPVIPHTVPRHLDLTFRGIAVQGY